jgi:SAM-dependent methyltransferase
MSPKLLRQRIRQFLSYLAAAYIDLRLWLTGKSDPWLPPLRLRFVGTGDFRKIGDDLFDLLISVGGLRPSDQVLDVGCGVGRVALPLTRYLDSTATYDGFDVVKGSIRWCQRHISRLHPNFRFHHVNVSNSAYRLRGVSASQFRFPFADASFDFLFATSLFTHLTLGEIHQYIAESARVLRPGGRLVATFFLLNDFSLASLPTRNGYAFPHVVGPLRFLDAENPGAGGAIQEEVLLQIIQSSGFVVETIGYGQWSGRQNGVSFQDVVACRRACDED